MADKKPTASDEGLVEPGGENTLAVAKRKDEKIGRTLARITLDPQTRNASLASQFGSKLFGDRQTPDITETSAVMAEEITRAMKGDLSLADRIFTSQAISLDAMFTDMARRSGEQVSRYPDAAERSMRLALKAQSACRATLEALTRLHQPREQTVKHVHVNDGGQAVVADHFHHHAGGQENGKATEQSHASGAAGDGAAVLSPDPFGSRVPIPSREGQAAVPNARGHQSGCA